jgi:Bacterial dnaA protein helix-turn-helix
MGVSVRTAVAIKQETAARSEDPPASPVPAIGNDAQRMERAIRACDSTIDLMSALFGIDSRELRRGGRTSRDATRVRQLAMYVAHVILKFSMKEVGVGFQRDRTTVLHACHLVEDLRDDPDFDQMAGLAERVVAAAFKNSLETAR